MSTLRPLASMLLLVASCRQQPPPPPSPSPDGALPASPSGPSASPASARPAAPTEPPSGACFLAPCHGSDLRCERGEPPMCTMSLEPGDACRRFASCSDEAGTCRLTKTPAFESCRACAARCANVDCEAGCAAKAGK